MSRSEIPTREARGPRLPVLRGRLFGARATVPTVPSLPPTNLGMPSAISGNAGRIPATGVTVLAASVQGLSHQSAGSVRQDSYAFAYDDRSIVVAVADGVGSARLSHLGSAIAANTAVEIATEGVIGATMVSTIVARLRNEANRIEQPVEDLATTLLVVRVQIGNAGDPWRVVAAEWGDSRLSVFSPTRTSDGHPDWKHFCTDPAADLANSVRALPAFREPTTYGAGVWMPGEVLLAATDGIDSHLRPENYVGHGLADAWSEVPTLYQFIADVGFERAGARDDRTAVCLFRPPVSAAEPS